MVNLSLLEQIGALITDSHVVYTSGKHGSSYVNKDAIYPHTQLTQDLCYLMAKPFFSEQVDAVLAPAIGGVILGHGIAHALSKYFGREVLSVYAEQTPDKNFVIKRGYDRLISGKKVLVVEDVLTTGGSVRKVVERAREIPCEIVGVSALCNRGGVTSEILGSVPRLVSVFNFNLDSWEPADCPLCKNQIPINTAVGKGKNPVK